MRPSRIVSLPAILALVSGMASLVTAQERRYRIDVEHYSIESEINPRTQSLEAKVQVRFVPLDDYTSSAAFELNNAMNVSKVEDGKGRQISASRSHQDFTVRVNFPEPLTKGQATTLTFTYDGRLTGSEESPVWGIKFAAINPDHAYLMYPSRWFPINDYTADRYTAEMKTTVPAGYLVVASGQEVSDRSQPDKVTFIHRFTQPSFPGSMAVVKGDPIRLAAGGRTTSFFVRDEARNLAGVYAEEIGKVMTFLTATFGLPPQANLTVVETESGTPNAYAAPGILFLAPKSFSSDVNARLLANHLSRQWWGVLLSAASRNHLWLTNGMARYAELLYLEHKSGPSAVEVEVKDLFVEALTVDNPPLMQAARFEDYSPEFWAATAAKGASVLHMLRYVIGDEPFQKLVKAFPEKHAWKSVETFDFRKAAEEASGKDLQYFFIQWIESSGAPEFKLEYTVYRTQNGFRIMGKIAQDLDTFRMPVDLQIETEGNPEYKQVEVVGTSSEFVVETFGKPKKVVVDPHNRTLRMGDNIRVSVAIRRGEQFAEIGEFGEALREYQKALDVNRNSSLAHYRVAEVFLLQRNYQSAANEFREALNGDLEPRWVEVWAHINLGKIFDITGQRERAVNEYNLAIRTKDNTQGAMEEAAKYLKEPYERPRQSY